MNTDDWCLFVSHLPGKEGAVRMRVWRALRAAGAAILRDGVYLLPGSPAAAALFDSQAGSVREAGGSAHVLRTRPADADGASAFRDLFDRGEDYAGWHREAAAIAASIARLNEAQARRAEASLRRTLDAIVATDFFPGPPRDVARRAMDELAAAVNARFSPDEPSPGHGDVEPRDPARYRARQWATRRGLWIDRVASAWLIRRFIDPQARFLWLAAPDRRPADVIGFDFDGAEFSHVGTKVTFEVLLEAFALTSDAALVRLGALVHHLDVGGAPVAEAPGVLAILGGARERFDDDDRFLDEASRLFDHLHAGFEPPAGSETP